MTGRSRGGAVNRTGRSAVEKSVAMIRDIEGRDQDLPCERGGGWWFDYGEPTYAVHGEGCALADATEREIYAYAEARR